MSDKEEYVSWDELTSYGDEIADYFEGEIDYIAAIVRGGMPIGVYLSHKLDAPVRAIHASHYEEKKRQGQVDVSGMHLSDITSNDTLLLFDDIVDTGDTMRTVKKDMRLVKPIAFDVKTAALHAKPDRLIDPDYFCSETDNWIVYPWEA